ncbi:NAD(P)-binding protein [Aeromonas schubertii]|uniref:Twin-arginine translocation pathway signal n=1 Tax=Aeromonas schubertii TaxID=652 RepID=A0A0S2SKT1_9GAMM|nr:FAD/NAD(P)-binding protein [Aeromonas schubertii]ALP42242.1 twin-arginine translocation pathway signal [Aeromonas schubertii]
MSITRRDFLNGVAITIASGVAPLQLLSAASGGNTLAHRTLAYPPALTGLRGNHPGAFETAHRIAREGKQYDFAHLPVEEEYDLVIVGAGISGLAAACFYRQALGEGQKILLLDNHDDFGGHAKRNEFTTPDGLRIGYGGSESLQSPRSVYSEVALGLLKHLNVDIDELAQGFRQTFYPDLGLSRGVFFDQKHFGVNKVVAGDPGRSVADEIPHDRLNGRPLAEFIGDFPLDEADRAALLALHEERRDYLPGMSRTQKEAWLARHSYSTFLRDKVGLSERAIAYFQQRTDDFQAIGIDATSCTDARLCALPGFGGMDLSPLDPEAQAELDDPYIFHFPDGNASLARLMVRHLIPGVAPGHTMQDLVLARFDYDRLDRPEQAVRLRLGSTALQAKNVHTPAGQGVEITYIKADKLHRVRARQAIMAGYNMMIPHLLPEMPAPQKEALRQNVKAPLVYSKVVIRHWHPFIKLGVHEIYAPAAPYSRVKLDYPVDLGGYGHARRPDQPVCLHMVYVPTQAGSGLSAREQARIGRAQLLGMPFEQHEQMIREQLQAMLGEAGFDHEQDILAITVNRWAHGYAYAGNSLFDDEDQSERWIEQARQPVGQVAIANSDAGWSPYAHAAIDEAWRAVKELVAMKTGQR